MRMSDWMRDFFGSFNRAQQPLKGELVRLPLPAPSAPPPPPTAERPRRRSAGYSTLMGGTIDPRDNPYAAGQRGRNRWADDKPHLDMASILEDLHAPRTGWPYHWDRRD
jgi:hypothetical protein